jgi:hypothetical protein
MLLLAVKSGDLEGQLFPIIATARRQIGSVDPLTLAYLNAPQRL